MLAWTVRILPEQPLGGQAFECRSGVWTSLACMLAALR
jgi:hypothetical protein